MTPIPIGILAVAGAGLAPTAAARAVFGGGATTILTKTIDYVSIPTAGNATDFGDLIDGTNEFNACASTTRACFMGGLATQGGVDDARNKIEYLTIATTGNAQDFGDLTVTVRYFPAAFNSSTRGIRAAGAIDGQARQNIDYITIATTGNALTFGNCTQGFYSAGCSSSTRGVFGNNALEFITIATTGNAVTFGNLDVGRIFLTSSSNSTRGLFAGGQTNRNVIDFITIATTGNATDFGDLTVGRQRAMSAANATRCLFAGGDIGGTRQDVIDFVTIASAGNATDFGDLTESRFAGAGTSDANGGTQ